MQKQLDISVMQIVGSPLCVASSDGQKVYDQLSVALKEQHSVMLSFRNVEILTSAFLNAAIGQLYGAFSEEQIRAFLQVEDIEMDDLELLKQVVETAKHYFSDPEKFKALEDGDEEI
jgi:hypothetical protein